MQQTTSFDGLMRLLEHRHFLPAAGMLVGIVAIVSSAIVVVLLVKIFASHRQRMAMIAQGMHPDAAVTEVVDDPSAIAADAHRPG